MDMDLEVLGYAHAGAVRQIQVLDTCLRELLRRREVRPITDASDMELDYLNFKIDVVKGVKQMYEVYRDDTWTRLQQESDKNLQEVLNIFTTTNTMDITEGSEDQDEELHVDSLLVHLIPVPLSPIEDIPHRGSMHVPMFSLMERDEMDTEYFSRD